MLGQFLFASPALVRFSLCLVILVCRVLCLVYVFFFYGWSFFCFFYSSHWESLVLGHVDVESV